MSQQHITRFLSTANSDSCSIDRDTADKLLEKFIDVSEQWSLLQKCKSGHICLVCGKISTAESHGEQRYTIGAIKHARSCRSRTIIHALRDALCDKMYNYKLICSDVEDE